MTGGAILMMSASLIIIWGGLLVAVSRLPRE